ncbi:MAG: sulfatase [Planctomycetaceae bacterium]|nr:sulfatase [Planctomycetaceae bacterium]
MSVFSITALAADNVPLLKRPNIVFFLVDDLGVNDVGAYNSKTFYETPNVDQLAKDGIRFTNGYAACCVCSPTRFSIQTGKYPVRNGCTDWFGANRSERFFPAPVHDRLDLNETTLGEAFKEAGYKTAFLGKWHLGPVEEFWPENQGFDINIGGCNRGNPGKDGYFSPYNNNPRLPDGPEGEFLTERLTNEAVTIIKNWKDAPFLLYFSFYQVHTPLQSPNLLIKKYQKKSQNQDQFQENFAEEEQNFLLNEPRLVRQQQNHVVYAGMVESMDTAVGKVIETLKAEGLYENTIICFVSDNGGLSTSEGAPTSNVPLRGGKGWLYEGGHRVAYIIRIPQGTPGVSDIPVITTDFYPTLLDLAGLPLKPQQHLDGISLKSIVDGKNSQQRDALYWHYPHYGNQGGFPGGVIRVGDWKLIRRYEDGRIHLYNLKDDPSEHNDLASVESERAERLAQKHNQWLQSVGAKFLEEKNGNKPWLPQ